MNTPQSLATEVFNPIGWDDFLANNWHKSIAHLSGAEQRFAALLNWDRLSRLLEWTPLRPRRMQLLRGGELLSEERYLRLMDGGARLDAGRLSAELGSGATLVVNFIDELIPELAELADELAKLLNVETSINVYASWREQSGLDLHADHHDVLVLQVEGDKHWSVYEPTRHNPLKGDPFVAPHPDAEPVWSGLLRNGGVLYIPAGFPHLASAVNGPSLHLTVALSESNGIDYLTWLVSQLRDDEDMRSASPRSSCDGWLTRVREVVANAVSPSSLASFHSARAGRLDARPRFSFPDIAGRMPLEWSEFTRIRLTSRRSLGIRYTVGGPTAVEVLAQNWPCSSSVGQRLATLSSMEVSDIGSLTRGLAPDQLAELKRILGILFASGALTTEQSA